MTHTSDPRNWQKQRKQLYVNSLIQGRMLTRFALYWALYHAVLWHVMFFYRYMQYRGELLAGARAVSFPELYGSFAAQHYAMLVCAVAVFPVIAWDILKLTHRFAGPLVRFLRALRQLAQGQTIPKIQLREGDMLVELQEAFNEFLINADLITKPVPEAGNREPQTDEERLFGQLQSFQNSVARWGQNSPEKVGTVQSDDPKFD